MRENSAPHACGLEQHRAAAVAAAAESPPVVVVEGQHPPAKEEPAQKEQAPAKEQEAAWSADCTTQSNVRWETRYCTSHTAGEVAGHEAGKCRGQGSGQRAAGSGQGGGQTAGRTAGRGQREAATGGRRAGRSFQFCGETLPVPRCCCSLSRSVELTMLAHSVDHGGGGGDSFPQNWKHRPAIPCHPLPGRGGSCGTDSGADSGQRAKQRAKGGGRRCMERLPVQGNRSAGWAKPLTRANAGIGASAARPRAAASPCGTWPTPTARRSRRARPGGAVKTRYCTPPHLTVRNGVRNGRSGCNGAQRRATAYLFAGIPALSPHRTARRRARHPLRELRGAAEGAGAGEGAGTGQEGGAGPGRNDRGCRVRTIRNGWPCCNGDWVWPGV
eukprot:gene3985-biopygen20365